MRIREAKDYLAGETARQAQLEGVSLSNLEKRMMYFTEGPGALEDPMALNAELEAHHDTAKYEKKISRLLYHAYKRVRKDRGEALQTWNNAIHCWNAATIICW